MGAIIIYYVIGYGCSTSIVTALNQCAFGPSGSTRRTAAKAVPAPWCCTLRNASQLVPWQTKNWGVSSFFLSCGKCWDFFVGTSKLRVVASWKNQISIYHNLNCMHSMHSKILVRLKNGSIAVCEKHFERMFFCALRDCHHILWKTEREPAHFWMTLWGGTGLQECHPILFYISADFINSLSQSLNYFSA